jgi:hypothetical protein
VTAPSGRRLPIVTRFHFALGALAGAAAAVLVLAATQPHAPGLALDGVAYVSAAESLVRTGELRTPFSRWVDADSTAALAQWPPGTSLLIALPHALGMPAIDSARLLLALCAFGTVLALALVTAEVAGAAAAVLVAAMAIVTPDLSQLHTSVWSEAPFLVCVVALLCTLVLAPDRPLRHGLIAAGAGLVRYVGVALSVAAALWALGRPGPWRARVRAAAIAALPGVLAQVWWAWRTTRENARIRSLQVSPPTKSSILAAGNALREWLVPARLSPETRTALAVALGVAVIALLAYAVRRVRDEGTSVSPRAVAPEARLYAAAGIIAACYSAVLLASKIFADPWISFVGRHLAPIMLLAEVAIAVALAAWWRSGRRSARALVGAALGLWLAASLTTSVADARWTMRHGLYMTNEYWRNAGVLGWVRTEGRRFPLYSNYPSAIYWHAGRQAREIPRIEEVRRVRHFGATLVRTGGVFVAFHAPSPWLLPNDEVARFLAFREVARFPDGVVWAPSDKTPRIDGTPGHGATVDDGQPGSKR